MTNFFNDKTLSLRLYCSTRTFFGDLFLRDVITKSLLCTLKSFCFVHSEVKRFPTGELATKAKYVAAAMHYGAHSVEGGWHVQWGLAYPWLDLLDSWQGGYLWRGGEQTKVSSLKPLELQYHLGPFSLAE